MGRRVPVLAGDTHWCAPLQPAVSAVLVEILIEVLAGGV